MVRLVFIAGMISLAQLGAAADGDISQFDRNMAVGGASAPTNGVCWLDGRSLPLEGRAFDDTAAYYERLPSAVSSNVNQGVHHLKRHTAGMVFRFATDSRRLRLRWTPRFDCLSMDHMPANGMSGIDIYRFDAAAGRWRYVQTGRISDSAGGAVDVDWTPGERCLVNLPLYNGLRDFRLGIDEGSAVVPLPPRANGVARPVVFYGTSITQGGCASRPGMAFVNIVGRELDVPVVNLGFSGSGKCELEMSDLVAAVDASCYVVDPIWNMDENLVRERYEPFIRNLRAKRPQTPIVMAEWCDVYQREPDGRDRFIRRLYERLISEEGWSRLYYLPKRDMYSQDGDGSVDGVHPNDLGMRHLADAFKAAVAEALGLPVGK